MKKTRKKGLAVLLTAGMLMLCGCQTTNTSSQPGEQGMTVIKEVEPIHFNQQAIMADGLFDTPDNVIPDKATADRYARLVLEIGSDGMYKTQLTQYDTEKEVWVVRFLPGEEVCGGDRSVAFSKKTGEVLLIWGGE